MCVSIVQGLDSRASKLQGLFKRALKGLYRVYIKRAKGVQTVQGAFSSWRPK